MEKLHIIKILQVDKFQDVALTYSEFYNFSAKLPSKSCWKCYFHLCWKGCALQSLGFCYKLLEIHLHIKHTVLELLVPEISFLLVFG